MLKKKAATIGNGYGDPGGVLLIVGLLAILAVWKVFWDNDFEAG